MSIGAAWTSSSTLRASAGVSCEHARQVGRVVDLRDTYKEHARLAHDVHFDPGGNVADRECDGLSLPDAAGEELPKPLLPVGLRVEVATGVVVAG